MLMYSYAVYHCHHISVCWHGNMLISTEHKIQLKLLSFLCEHWFAGTVDDVR